MSDTTSHKSGAQETFASAGDVAAPGATAPTTGGAPGDSGATEPAKERHGSLTADAWRDLRSSTTFWISAAMLSVLVLMAVAPGLFTNVSPEDCQLSRSLGTPGSAAWFGYDFQGCDLYSRVVYGARASILVGVLVTLGTTLLGGVIGAFAGFYGGWVDALLSRIVDIFFGLPLILGGLVFLSVFRLEGIWGVVLALTLLGWTSAARILRSSVIATKNVDYVAAARGLGAGDGRILLRHVLPNSLAPAIVVAMISLGVFIASEATLSFLGIGLQPPTISWGIQISDASRYFLQAPHILLFPSLFLSLTVLSFILLGDAVRDALDPKLR